MEIRAKKTFIRTSARKVRLVADLIRSKKPQDAVLVLENLPKRAAGPVLDTLRQAIANATKNFNIAAKDVVFKRIEVNDGPTYKRWQPVSRGMAHAIQKRTSHITIILEGKEAEEEITSQSKK